jgi:hydroxymethylglutaryl-CoA lyase
LIPPWEALEDAPIFRQAAGNIPTEDAVYMLEEMGIKTGIDLEAIIAAARRLEAIVGHILPGQVMKSGARILAPRI